MISRTREYLSGFTLIELVVSMAIISTMAAITIVSMSGAKTKQEVEGAARQVAAAIREAQNYAVTGKSINGAVPCQFRISATATSSTFQLQQTNSTTCGAVSGSVSYSLQNGVQFSAAAEIRFDVPRGEPRDASNAELSSGNIDFVISKSGSTAHVCAYPLGRIEEKRVGENC
jgi:prepilin-type N-terminal cleavage/methylation domain-containing protein